MTDMISDEKDLAVANVLTPDAANGVAQAYRLEPLDTPGIIPQHLKRGVVQGIPLVEIAQRLLYRVRPGLPEHLDIILAGIALWKAGAPIYQFLKRQLLQWLTS